MHPPYLQAHNILKEPEITPFIKQIGGRIRELRKEKNMTQLDLATKSNIDERQIQRLEATHTSPTIKTLFKAIHGLDMNFSEFFNFPEK